MANRAIAKPVSQYYNPEYKTNFHSVSGIPTCYSASKRFMMKLASNSLFCGDNIALCTLPVFVFTCVFSVALQAQLNISKCFRSERLQDRGVKASSDILTNE
jgi:hypothetical protein